MTRVAYSYFVLRYAHDPISGESLNVAVVLLGTDGSLEFRIPSSLTRLKRAFPDANVSGVRHALISLERNCRDFMKRHPLSSLADMLQHVMPADDNVWRLSKPGAGLASSLSRAAEELLERFVLRCDTEFADGEIVSSDAGQQRTTWRKVKEGTVRSTDNLIAANDYWIEPPRAVGSR